MITRSRHILWIKDPDQLNHIVRDEDQLKLDGIEFLKCNLLENVQLFKQHSCQDLSCLLTGAGTFYT